MRHILGLACALVCPVAKASWDETELLFAHKASAANSYTQNDAMEIFQDLKGMYAGMHVRGYEEKVQKMVMSSMLERLKEKLAEYQENGLFAQEQSCAELIATYERARARKDPTQGAGGKAYLAWKVLAALVVERLRLEEAKLALASCAIQ